MKKSNSQKRWILASAAVALASASSGVSAQSSVTISGIVDLAAQRIRTFDGLEKNQVATGFKSSRIRFSGFEDVGGGLRFGFMFEGGLNVDTGATSGFGAFHRASWLSVQQPTWGTVRIGKALVP